MIYMKDFIMTIMLLKISSSSLIVIPSHSVPLQVILNVGGGGAQRREVEKAEQEEGKALPYFAPLYFCLCSNHFSETVKPLKRK